MSKLVIENVSKKYGKTPVFENLNLEFETGHCYALLGRNGAGKSTLINIIMQRAGRNGGRITLDGKNIDNSDKLLSRMFCMNDSSVYPPELKLKTIFNITASMYPSFDREYAEYLASLFGLDMKKRAGKLSTGYNTIYKVILAMASGADFIFLDEPVLGIDVNQRELFYKELARKMSSSDSCFVISTHIIEEIQNLIEKVIILHNGKIIVSDDAENLLSNYVAVSGRADLADVFAAGKDVVGAENMSVFKTIAINTHGEEISSLPDGLNIENIGLQKLFYFLMGGVPDIAEGGGKK